MESILTSAISYSYWFLSSKGDGVCAIGQCVTDTDERSLEKQPQKGFETTGNWFVLYLGRMCTYLGLIVYLLKTENRWFNNERDRQWCQLNARATDNLYVNHEAQTFGVKNFPKSPSLKIYIQKYYTCRGTRSEKWIFEMHVFLARYRAYGIVPIFFGVSTITFERINRLTSNFAQLEITQK